MMADGYESFGFMESRVVYATKVCRSLCSRCRVLQMGGS